MPWIEHEYRSIRTRALALTIIFAVIVAVTVNINKSKLERTIQSHIAFSMTCAGIDKLRAELSKEALRIRGSNSNTGFPASLEVKGFDQNKTVWQIRLSTRDPRFIRSKNLVDSSILLAPNLARESEANRNYPNTVFIEEVEFKLCERFHSVDADSQDLFGAGVWYQIGFPIRSSLVPIDASRQIFDLVRWMLFLTIVPLLLGLVALFFWLVARETKKLSHAIDAISDGREQRITVRLATELYFVKRSVNGLLDHYEGLVNRTRRFMAKVAHDLNNRSQAISAMIANDSELDRTKLQASLASMKALVERYGSLSRTSVGTSGGGANPLNARVNVLDKFASLVDVLKHSDHGYDKEVTDYTDDPTLVFHGHEGDIDALVSNLLRNAAKYGRSRIGLAALYDGDTFKIVVEDDGDGVDSSAVDRIFEFGARVDHDKPGSGFGLTIVRDVVEIYKGIISVARSEKLGGAMFTVTFPAAAVSIDVNAGVDDDY